MSTEDVFFPLSACTENGQLNRYTGTMDARKMNYEFYKNAVWVLENRKSCYGLAASVCELGRPEEIPGDEDKTKERMRRVDIGNACLHIVEMRILHDAGQAELWFQVVETEAGNRFNKLAKEGTKFFLQPRCVVSPADQKTFICFDVVQKKDKDNGST